MTDVWDIARYVESHPENREQRWRLAKKFYLSWEYRHALEHLSVLSNEMPESINVRRYLAATYYRLNRHDDAVRTLGLALAKWPSELGLHVQLAHTLHAAGKPLEAADAWERVAKIDPSHPFAKQAAATLREQVYGKAEPPLSTVAANFITPAPSNVSCPHCGAANYPEFDRCGRCNAPLDFAGSGSANTGEALTAAKAFGDEGSTGRRWGALSIDLTIVGMLSAGVYLAVRQFILDNASGDTLPVWTMDALLARELALTKVVAAVILLPTWPSALYMVMGLFGIKVRSERAVIRSGLFLAAAAFVFFWLPAHLMWLAVAVPMALSAVPVLFLLGIPSTHALLVWLIQGIVVSIAALIPPLVLNGAEFVLDLPSIMRQAAITEETPKFVYSGHVPFALRISWENPGGGNWAADTASTVSVHVETGPHAEPIDIGLMDGGATLFYRTMEKGQDSLDFLCPAVPLGKPLDLRVQGEATTISLELQGLFPFRFADASGISP